MNVNCWSRRPRTKGPPDPYAIERKVTGTDHRPALHSAPPKAGEYTRDASCDGYHEGAPPDSR
jgi:hypothetical protein